MIDVTSATTTRTHDGYHHGDLPNALRRAAVEVIAERGVGGFSLREVARRAGVSHTAPAHHFGDMKGLLTSVAEEGFNALHDAMVESVRGVDDPVDRLIELGRAYVTVAGTHRAHFEVMWRTDIIDTDNQALTECGTAGYGVLEDTVRAVIEGEGLSVDLDEATWLCWSAIQGLLQLEPKITLMSALHERPVQPIDELVARFTRMIVDGLRHTT